MPNKALQQTAGHDSDGEKNGSGVEWHFQQFPTFVPSAPRSS